MEKNEKIYVAGHRGLIGSAIMRRLRKDGFSNLVTRTHSELDLTDQTQVKTFFEKERPDYVFFAAARVGGIFANNRYRGEFIYENTMMQNNVIHQAFMNEAKKMVFFASADIYPKQCPQPAKEEYLLEGALEFTCEPFAIAKIAGLKMCESYNRQYGTDFIVVIPPNVYGPNQHYDVMNAQVLPSLIKKFHDAKVQRQEEIVIWGTGSPVRDFIYVDDVADVCVFLTGEYSGNDTFNVGTGRGYTISELVGIIKEEVGYEGTVRFDSTKPDGVAKKLLDTTKINELGWRHNTELAEGVRCTYRAFLEEMDRREVRVTRISKVDTTEKDISIVDTKRRKPLVQHAQPDTYKNKVVMKPWGYEFLMFENECVAVWFLYLKKGHSTSMHCHPGKKTSLILLSGNAMSNTFHKRRYLNGGEALIIEKGVFHSTKALSDDGICLLEIETPPNKTDLMRLEDSYGRESAGYEGIKEMQAHNLGEYNYFNFEESDCCERSAYTMNKYAISFEVFFDNDDFQEKFRTRNGELYTSCRGSIMDKNGSALLDTGDTQNANVFTDLKGLSISGKTVILKTLTVEG
ncbi:MAG: NAD-dependent epimerase/dehydratase family protein [Thermodesulfobacteriota bacterium]